MRRLRLVVPVVAAPMAGGPTTPSLVGAVASTGALAFVPGGYRDVEQFAGDLAAARAAVADAGADVSLLGVNLFVPSEDEPDREAVRQFREGLAPEAAALGVELGPERWRDDDQWNEKLDLLARDPVAWVSFTFGLPSPGVLGRLREAGTRVLVTVTDADEAERAAEARPDGLIVQGHEAGGHRGTFEQRRRPGNEPLEELIGELRSRTALPVVAAGGVADAARVRAVLDAGAEAVQVGTALMLSDEAGTRGPHREALADPTSETTTMRVWTGRVARGIRTPFTDRHDPWAPPAYPALHHLTTPIRRWAAEHGDREHLHLWAGTGHLKASTGPVADVVRTLAP